MGITAYSFAFMASLSLLTFWLALKVKADPSKKNNHFFQSISISQNGRERETGSAVASAIFLGLLLFVGLFLAWLLEKYFSYGPSILLSVLGVIGSPRLIYKFISHLWGGLHRRLTLMLSGAAGLVVGCLWIIWPTWLSYDLFGVIVGCYLISLGYVEKMRYLVFGFLVVMIYDAVSVFGTKLMIEVALNHNHLLAGVLIIPKDMFDFSESVNINRLRLLGLGDVVMSGFAVYTARRHNLQWWTIAGYLVGLALTLIALNIFHRGMPAMIFLAPALLLFMYLGAWFQKQKLAW